MKRTYNIAMWQDNSMYIEARHGLLCYCKKGLNDFNQLLTNDNKGVFDCKHLLKVLPNPFVTTCDKFFNRESSLLNHIMDEVNRHTVILADMTLLIGHQTHVRLLCQTTIQKSRTALWNSDFRARIVLLKVCKEENNVHFVQLYNTKEGLFLQNSNPKLARNYLLSKIELDILRLYVHDMCRTRIANVLCKSESTIDTHIRNVYKRLNINTLSEARIYIDSLSIQTDQLH